MENKMSKMHYENIDISFWKTTTKMKQKKIPQELCQ
jgi:hypothetical protein